MDTDDTTALSSIENRSKEEDAVSSSTTAQQQQSSQGGSGGAEGEIESVCEVSLCIGVQFGHEVGDGDATLYTAILQT